MKNYAARVQAQLDTLNPRERKLVSWAALFATLVFVWLVLLEPAINTLDGADARRTALLEKANKVTEAALNLDAMRGSRSQISVKAEELGVRVQKLAAEAGLTAHLEMQTDSTGHVSATLKNAPAAGVLRWLAMVDGLGSVRVTQASLSKPEAGTVEGSVTISQLAGKS